MKAIKLLKIIPFLTSLLYFFNFIGFIIISKYWLTNKELPVFIYSSYNNYLDFYIYFPLIMILIMIYLFKFRKKIIYYYLAFLILIFDLILGGFFTYLWNPNV